jgi:hypothetical protein
MLASITNGSWWWDDGKPDQGYHNLTNLMATSLNVSQQSLQLPQLATTMYWAVVLDVRHMVLWQRWPSTNDRWRMRDISHLPTLTGATLLSTALHVMLTLPPSSTTIMTRCTALALDLNNYSDPVPVLPLPDVYCRDYVAQCSALGLQAQRTALLSRDTTGQVFAYDASFNRSLALPHAYSTTPVLLAAAAADVVMLIEQHSTGMHIQVYPLQFGEHTTSVVEAQAITQAIPSSHGPVSMLVSCSDSHHVVYVTVLTTSTQAVTLVRVLFANNNAWGFDRAFDLAMPGRTSTSVVRVHSLLCNDNMLLVDSIDSADGQFQSYSYPLHTLFGSANRYPAPAIPLYKALPSSTVHQSSDSLHRSAEDQTSTEGSTSSSGSTSQSFSTGFPTSALTSSDQAQLSHYVILLLATSGALIGLLLVLGLLVLCQRRSRMLFAPLPTYQADCTEVCLVIFTRVVGLSLYLIRVTQDALDYHVRRVKLFVAALVRQNHSVPCLR